jgi:hypothetical protein
LFFALSRALMNIYSSFVFGTVGSSERAPGMPFSPTLKPVESLPTERFNRC